MKPVTTKYRFRMASEYRAICQNRAMNRREPTMPMGQVLIFLRATRTTQARLRRTPKNSR
jgi:hypothetical protein